MLELLQNHENAPEYWYEDGTANVVEGGLSFEAIQLLRESKAECTLFLKQATAVMVDALGAMDAPPSLLPAKDGKPILGSNLYDKLKPSAQDLENLNLSLGPLLFQTLRTSFDPNDVLETELSTTIEPYVMEVSSLATKMEKVIQIWKAKLEKKFSNSKLLMMVNASHVLQKTMILYSPLPQSDFARMTLIHNRDMGHAFLYGYAKAMVAYVSKTNELIEEIMSVDLAQIGGVP